MSSSSSSWTPTWGTIPELERSSVDRLAHYCYAHSEVLADPKVMDTVCQFAFPRINFPYSLKNYDELMAHIGLRAMADVISIQSDPAKVLRTIVAYATTPSSMWGASDPGSACWDWPYELTAIRLLARAIAKAAAE